VGELLMDQLEDKSFVSELFRSQLVQALGSFPEERAERQEREFADYSDSSWDCEQHEAGPAPPGSRPSRPGAARGLEVLPRREAATRVAESEPEPATLLALAVAPIIAAVGADEPVGLEPEPEAIPTAVLRAFEVPEGCALELEPLSGPEPGPELGLVPEPEAELETARAALLAIGIAPIFAAAGADGPAGLAPEPPPPRGKSKSAMPPPPELLGLALEWEEEPPTPPRGKRPAPGDVLGDRGSADAPALPPSPPGARREAAEGSPTARR
jgi:hypothetical protein